MDPLSPSCKRPMQHTNTPSKAGHVQTLDPVGKRHTPHQPRAAASDAAKEASSLLERVAPVRKQLARAQQQRQQLLDKRDDLEHQIQALRAEIGTPLGGQLSPDEAASLQTLSAQLQALEGEVSVVEAARDDAQALAEQLEGQLEGTLRGALKEALHNEDAGRLR